MNEGQHDEHVWAFRWHRFRVTGFMIGVVYSDGYHPIDPRDYFL